MKNLDPRARRTRKWLQVALMELIREKPFSKISISEISQRADLSRTTFYLHYSTKEELFQDRLDSVYMEFMEEIDSIINDVNLETLAVRLFTQSTKNKPFFQNIHDSEIATLLLDRFRKYTNEVLEKYFSLNAGLMTPEFEQYEPYIIAGVAGSIFSVLVEWLTDENEHSPENMGLLIINLNAPGVFSIMANGLQEVEPITQA